MLCITCGSKTEKCPTTDENNPISQQKLNHGDALVYIEELLGARR